LLSYFLVPEVAYADVLLFQVPARFRSLVTRLQDAADDLIAVEDAGAEPAAIAAKEKILGEL